MGLKHLQSRVGKLVEEVGQASSINRRFLTTHWSVVLRAGGRQSSESDKALAELCQSYWYPLYSYVRRKGYKPEDAKDAVQNFFLKLSTQRFFKTASPEKGSFRGFLLMTLKRFLANEWHSRCAIKRGGGQPLISLSVELAESRYEIEPEDQRSPDLLFDRQWASTLLELVFKQLKIEYAEAGKERLFNVLQNGIAKGAGLSHAEAAGQLDMTEGAVKVALHRLRARYRYLLREEIGKTVASADEIDGEIRHLFSTFSE